MLKKFSGMVSAKAAELANKRKVYVGSMQGNEWRADTLIKRYLSLVGIESAAPYNDKNLPPTSKGSFTFVGGNSNQIVYISDDVAAQWLATAKDDSHWAAAAMLRPGKLSDVELEFNWEGYATSDVDSGVLAIFSDEDWSTIVNSFGLPKESLLAQVTVFDLENCVSGKGTMRKAFKWEQPTVYPNSWKMFGNLRTRFMSVLTTDAVYQPKAGINAQEISYWVHNRGRKLAAWVTDALAEAAASVLAERGSTWQTTGWLSALGLSGSLRSAVRALADGQRHGLQNLMRSCKLGEHLGFRAKTSATDNLAHGYVFLPESASRYVSIGDTVVISRNPALPSQDWQVYKVARFIEGHMVVFAATDPGWNNYLGGDHDGDDAVVLYQSPIVCQVGDALGQPGLDLQAIKPSARKLGAGQVEDRLLRWQQEQALNIGTFDMIARRLQSVGMLTTERSDMLTTAIQVVIALKKRVAKLEEQDWYEEVKGLMQSLKPLVGSTDVDKQREFKKGETNQLFNNDHWNNVANILRDNLVHVTESARFVDTDEKRAEFGLNAEAHELVLGMVAEYNGLRSTKAMAKLENRSEDTLFINQRLKVLVHLEGPEVVQCLSEEDWKRSSKWLIANTEPDVWAFWAHPEIISDYLAFLGNNKVRILGDMQTLAMEVGEVIEVEDSGKRVLTIDGQECHVAEDTVYLPAGSYEVTAVSNRGMTLVRY